MADVSSWEGLKAAVADWLGRDDLTERIPLFIRLAEKRMDRELRLRVMERRAVTAVQAGQRAVPLPWRREEGRWDVFLEMRDLAWRRGGGTASPQGWSGGRSLRYLPPDTYAEHRKEGVPRSYTIAGRDLFLLPAPDGPGELLLTYWAEVPPLGPSQPDNAVLLTAPDLYLYGALVESGPFTRGSAPLELWTQYWSAAKKAAAAAETRARFTSNLSMCPVRRV